ncbi:unnamed protein product [Ilex paraguariensis]|uniref:Reverse transcriptase domain-containing protein n=1 Tax=Ilex paraguariensis TaxID=185542 RepID=A0ABC8T225_9AQUA
MLQMGFHPNWVDLIVQCISPVQYDVIANGETRCTLKPQQGIRQGDPLSPYLFLLVVHVLSRIIHEEVREGNISGIRIQRRNPTLSHLFLADDSRLFVKADIQESNHLMDILRRFSMASGQLINLKKSGIIFSGNTQEDKRTEICQNLQMSPLPLNWDSQLFVADQKHKHSTTLWSES